MGMMMYIYMKSHNKRDTEDESDTVEGNESDTEDELNDTIYDITKTFDYSLQLRKKFREKIEHMEEIN